MRKYLTVFALVCLCLSVKSQSFEGSGIGKGIRFSPKDSSFSLQWNIRYQTQYAGLYNLENEDYTDALTTRRFRLKFKGFVFNPNLQYKMELALSNRDQGDFFAENRGAASIILDAVLKWKFSPGWQLWVGQTKLPGNRERVISSGSLQLVDRSRLNSRYNIDRDKGIQLYHEHKLGKVVLREIGAITSGEGRNVSLQATGGYDYTIRGEILPFGKFKSKGDYFGTDLKREETPKLSIGATYDYNVGSSRERGQLGKFVFNDVEDTDGDQEYLHSDLATVFVDAYFKYNGWSLMYEYANKKIASGREWGYVTGADGSGGSSDIVFYYTGQAHNIQGGYLFKNNFGIDGRFTKNTPSKIQNPENTDQIYHDAPERRYEIGFSKYIVGHTVKVQTSVVYRDKDGTESNKNKDDEMIFFAQVEIGF